MAPTCKCRPVRIHIQRRRAVLSTFPSGFKVISPMDKAGLRKAARSQRLVLSQAMPDFATRIAGADIPVSVGVVVAGYWPMADEADPRGLMASLAGMGAHLALPCVPGRAMALVFRHWSFGNALVPGVFGTEEPVPSAPIVVPDILLVPLLAFDAAGYRLGYGGGYYDRTLADLRKKKPVLAVGVAYGGQMVNAVPREDTDEPLDLLVSETGLWRFA